MRTIRFSDVYKNPLISTKNFLVNDGNSPNNPSGVFASISTKIGTPKNGKIKGASRVAKRIANTITLLTPAPTSVGTRLIAAS